MRIAFAAFLRLALALCLAGCVGLPSAGRFDQGIVDAINDYHANAVSFVATMEREAGRPEGRATSPVAVAFYARYQGVLANLVLRAEASPEPQTCTGSKAVTALVRQMVGNADLVDSAQPAARKLIGELGSDLDQATSSGSFADGSCTVIILKVLVANQALLESIHRENGKLAPPTSTIAIGLIGDGVRIALINEQAKR